MSRGPEPIRPEEQVLVDARPHPKTLFAPSLMTAGALVAAVAVRDIGRPDRWPLLLCVALAGLAGVQLAVRWARWTTARLVVTSDRIMTRRGVLRKRHWQLPLERIHDITLEQSLWERLMASGDLVIESGGDRGHLIPDVARPFRVQDEIYEAMEQSTVTSAARAMDRRDLSVPEQIERLDELRQRGVISDTDFDVKKSQLLDRM